MFEILVLMLICLIGVALDTTRTVRRQRALFAEFGQTTAIQWLAWLYPLPLAIPLLVPQSAPYLLFPLPLGILFFLPAIAVGIRNRSCFQHAGTDRVDRAQHTADHVVMSGLFAVLCFVCVAVLLWILRSLL